MTRLFAKRCLVEKESVGKGPSASLTYDLFNFLMGLWTQPSLGLSLIAQSIMFICDYGQKGKVRFIGVPDLPWAVMSRL